TSSTSTSGCATRSRAPRHRSPTTPSWRCCRSRDMTEEMRTTLHSGDIKPNGKVDLWFTDPETAQVKQVELPATDALEALAADPTHWTVQAPTRSADLEVSEAAQDAETGEQQPGDDQPRSRRRR